MLGLVLKNIQRVLATSLTGSDTVLKPLSSVTSLPLRLLTALTAAS